jgi:hypothetical protein
MPLAGSSTPSIVAQILAADVYIQVIAFAHCLGLGLALPTAPSVKELYNFMIF